VIEIPDGETVWRFDESFLRSNWTCIWGRGCKGILDEPAEHLGQGCCSVGAELDGVDESMRISALAATLDPSRFEHHAEAAGAGIFADETRTATRVVDGACIFLNRPGFPNGPGCALHQAAAARGMPHLALKPDVCWQLPLRRDEEAHDDGHVTSTIQQWDRRHWGTGGEDFHWWCTEAPEAFTEREPVYRTLRDELIAMSSRPVYDMLAAYLDERAGGPTAPLPHPAERPVELVRKRR